MTKWRVISTAILLWACALGEPAIGPAQAQQPDIPELKVWWVADGRLRAYLRDSARRFEEQNPGVSVRIEVFAVETYKSLLQIGLTSTSPPDVFFNWPGDDTFRFAREGLVEDLTHYMARPGWWGERLWPAAIDEFRDGDGVWGAPYLINTKTFYYNLDFFTRHGLRIPETFSELIASCDAIRAADPDMTPLLFGNNQRWPGIHYMTALNGKLVPVEIREADYGLTAKAEGLFQHPGYVAALKRLLSLKEARCFRYAINATSPNSSYAMFTSEIGAMVFCGSWCQGIFNSQGFAGRFSSFPMPAIEGAKGDNAALLGGSEGPEISANSTKKELAATFINHLVSPAEQAEFARTQQRHPADLDIAQEVAFDRSFDEVTAQIVAAPRLLTWLDVILDNEVSEAYLNSTQLVLMDLLTPDEAMNRIRASAVRAQKRRNQ